MKFLLLLTLLSSMAAPPHADGSPKIQITLLYTNDVMGEVEPCG